METFTTFKPVCDKRHGEEEPELKYQLLTSKAHPPTPPPLGRALCTVLVTNVWAAQSSIVKFHLIDNDIRSGISNVYVCVCKNNLSFFIIEFNKTGTNLGTTKGCASFSLCLLKLVTRAPMTCPLDASERLCSSRALRAIARFSFSALFAFFSEYETNTHENSCLLHT